MRPPTERQALAYWLHASGMTARQIGEHLGCSRESAQVVLAKAQAKARALGFSIQRTPQPITIVGSGMTVARQLAMEAGLLP